MPAARRSSSLLKPSTARASRISWYVWPVAAMPIQSSPDRAVTRLRWLIAPYWRASSVRTSKNSCSRSSVYGVMRRPSGCGVNSTPSTSIVGRTGTTRSARRSTVPVPSATGVTSLRPDQSPHERDTATAWRASSSASWVSPGNSTGMCRSTIVASLDDGQGRRLGARVVADHGHHTAAVRGAREHAVANRVAGAVDARALAVPHAEHAVVGAILERDGELAAHHRTGGEFLVDAGLVDDRQARAGCAPPARPPRRTRRRASPDTR